MRHALRNHYQGFIFLYRSVVHGERYIQILQKNVTKTNLPRLNLNQTINQKMLFPSDVNAPP